MAETKEIKDFETVIRVGEREIPLIYNMRTHVRVEEEMGADFYELLDKVNKGKRNAKTVIEAIRIMGNEGLRICGEEPDLTTEWLMDNMHPANEIGYRVAVLGALVSGWRMETDNSEEEEQDVTLNEIRKKNGNTD